MISCGMDAYGKSVPSKQITPVRRHWQSTERQMMRMQHAYRVDECLLVCGQPSATWAELGSPRDKKIAMSTARKLLASGMPRPIKLSSCRQPCRA